MRRSTDPSECTAPAIQRQPWDPDLSVEQVVAWLEPWVGQIRRQRLVEVFSRRLESVTVLLDAPHDPHNGAAIVRSCEAFGVQELHVLPRLEPFILARRVAKGTHGWVDIIEHSTPEMAIGHLRSRGFELVAAHPQGKLVPDDLAQIERITLVVGNEHRGVCPELLATCSRGVRVPMRGFVESLNVSVCAAILLAAATRGRAGDLPPARQQELYARGLFRTVPRAGEVLRAQKTAAGPRSTGEGGGQTSEPMT